MEYIDSVTNDSRSIRMNPYLPDISIFISKGQYEQMRAQIEQLEKYTAFDFINKELIVEFKDGKPVSVTHSGIPLGDNTCYMRRKSRSDKEFPIPLSNKFKSYLVKNKNFTLTLNYVNDGVFNAYIARAYDANGGADFTDYGELLVYD